MTTNSESTTDTPKLVTYWKVDRIMSSEDETIADLIRIEWFIENPEYTAWEEAEFARLRAEGKTDAEIDAAMEQAYYSDNPAEPQEFIPADPSDDGAKSVPLGGRMQFDPQGAASSPPWCSSRPSGPVRRPSEGPATPRSRPCPSRTSRRRTSSTCRTGS